MEATNITPLVDSIQLVNLEKSDVSPFIRKVSINVAYKYENRNGSYLTDEGMLELAKSLRGVPIVGHFKKEKDDFGGHDSELIINEDGIEFKNTTIPYGFVDMNADVWYQDVKFTNEFNETVTKHCLFTTGYVWLKQFKELEDLCKNGKGQSMELDEESIQGHWSQMVDRREFFIIDSAKITKLCILGDAVEPCFEPSMIAPIDDNKHGYAFSLNHMVKEFNHFYSINNENNFQERKDPSMEELKNLQEKYNALVEEKSKLEVNHAIANQQLEDSKKAYEALEKELDDLKTNFENVTTELKDTTDKYTALEKENTELKTQNETLSEFQKKVVDQAKKDMVDSFSTLSAEEKKDVSDNLDNYSLEEVEAKLSIIYARKVKSASAAKNDNTNNITTAFALENSDNADVPALARALESNRK